MKRKVTKVGKFRFSPNEEALLLKEEFERRRKQRLLQVREQERCIALQIRQEVKQKRDQYLHHLAEELRTEWQKTQEQKIKELEKLYIASLRSVGEGHRGAKENDPGIQDLIKQREERQQRAVERGQEALKKVKNEKEKLLKQNTCYVETRKKVLLEEKERAAKIASLPPPPPDPFEAILTLKTCSLPGKGTNVQVKGISTLKTNTTSNPPTYYHLDPSFISKEKDLEQPDPHLAAEEETKRLEELQKEAIRERREQLEKAHIRGVHAMRKVHLAKSREKIMKELEQLQKVDLARRRQNVAQMPPQVVELPYKRMAIKEDWQRELEFAFEDMYNEDRKVKGDLILKLEPEPLPVVTELIQNEELDLSMEQDSTSETQNQERMEEETPFLAKTEIPVAQETQHASSKTVLKKLLDRIQSQKSQWANKYTSEDESEMPKIFADAESETLTVETGTITSEEKPLDRSEHRQEQGETKQLSDIGDEAFQIELGTTPKKEKTFENLTESGKKKESSESEISLLDERSVLLYPHEETTQVRTLTKRQKQMMKLEQQKQKQLELIKQIEQQRIRLESECLKAQKIQLEHERKEMKERNQPFYLRLMKSYPFMDQWEKEANPVSQPLIDDAPTLDLNISKEDCSRQMIHNYQQHLLQQNRFHRQSIDAARKRLHEYQNLLKQRYPSRSTKSFSSDVVKPKGESLLVQASSHLQGVPELSNQHSLPNYPAVTGHSQLLPIDSSERISSDQTALSYSGSLFIQPSLSSVPSAEPESKFGRIKDVFSTKSQSPQLSSESSEDRCFIFSDHILSQKDNLKMMQEELDVQRETLHFSEKTPELGVHKQTELQERILSNQTDFSSVVPFPPQHSLVSPPSADLESGSIQEPLSFKSDSLVPSSHSPMEVIPDRLLSSSEDTLNQQYNLNTVQEQLNIQREALHSCLKAQAKLVSHQSASVDEKIPSCWTRSSPLVPLAPQHSLSSSLSAESGETQKLFLTKNESTMPSSPSIKQVFQYRPLISETSLYQQDSLNILKTIQGQLTVKKEALHFDQKAHEENLLNRPTTAGEEEKSTQTGSPLLSLFPKLVLDSLPLDESESVGIQELHLTSNETTSYSTTQDRCLTSSKPILVQQANWKINEEQLDMQRELFHSSEKTQKELIVLQPDAVEERIFSTHTGPSLIPLFHQHSFSSLHSTKSESEGICDPLARKYEPECPSSISSIQIFQDKILAPSEHILPQQHNQVAIQEPLNVQREAFCFPERSQEELLVQSKIALEERLSPNQTDFSFLPLIPQHSFTSLPSTESGGIQIASSHLATPNNQIFQEKVLPSPDHIFPQQVDLNLPQERLAKEKKTLQFSERLQQQTVLNERLFSGQTDSSLVPSSAEHASSSQYFNSEEIQNPLLDKSKSTFPSRYSTIPIFQDRLSTSVNNQYQQDNSKALQEQWKIHRKTLHFDPRSQLQNLDYKLNAVEERTSNQTASSPFLPLLPFHSVSSLLSTEGESNSDSGGVQESFLISREDTLPLSQSSVHTFHDRLLASSKHFSAAQDNLKELQKQLNIQKEFFEGRQKAQEEWFLRRQTELKEQVQKHEETLMDSLYEHQDIEKNHQEELNDGVESKINDSELLSENIIPDEHAGQLQNKELRLRLSKPPLAKIRSGLDLNQHELSVIQEVESPKSGRTTSTREKRECYRETASKSASSDLDSSNHEETVSHHRDPGRISVSQCLSLEDRSQETSQGQTKDVVTENHELLSFATDIGQKVPVYSGSAFKPKKIVPSLPWSSNDLSFQSHAQELQDDQSSSLTVSSGSFLSNEKTHLNLANSVNPDLTELEQTFPHLRQLFHTLDPRPDLNLSSSLSQNGLSQDLSKTTYPSSLESQDASGSHESTTSTTAVRARFHSSLNVNLDSAMNRSAMSEESFQPLQPEFTPSESSQSADLLSIISIETEELSQKFKKEKFPLRKECEELLIQRRNADFLPSVASLQSPTFRSSDDANLFVRMKLPHSTPYNSYSSKSSITDQMDSRKVNLGFEELSDEMKQHQTEVINSAWSEISNGYVVRDPELHSERSNRSIASDENVEVFRNTSQPLPSSFLTSLKSCSLQSSIPVWETISGHGIMEESELTLISSSDNSVIESESEHLIQEENRGSDFQVKQDSELKEDYSVWKPDLTITEPPVERPSSSLQHPDRVQEVSSKPGSLQEAFVKKNNSFIERSSLRQKEIKNKVRTSGKCQPKSALKKHPLERKLTGPTMSQLKKVNEVKVCFLEDKNTAQALSHQQTLRLHNQSAEERQQKEEESRQEAYAKNRERAKEFHRKTLEKLRAKTFH
ncbi:centrosomal protein of 295 kDa isoform X3 [Macrotis lagotis]|uniref:centrosomal protein of 295 kDa isoform X3 n=1 Tax=Macrotis lagotis TaxID=92651 RepID=UPI003D6881FE